MGRFRLAGLVLAVTLLLSGCVRTEPVQRQFFAMDTFMTLTAYGKGAEDVLEQGENYILRLEGDISVTRPDSDISRLNEGRDAEVSEQTFALLTDALKLCEVSGGVLDITAYPAVKAWGFTAQEHRVPDEEELAQLAEHIDYTAVTLDEATRRVVLPESGAAAVDLGAVAKGWVGEQLAQMVRDAGITSALLSLGGNIQTVGAKPDGSPWRVGIQDPDSPTGAYLASVAVMDRAVVTSGGYQRFFEQDGEVYWHILDPETAAPARSGVTSATIVGAQGSLCDAFSTALFVMGAEQAAAFWRANPQLDFDYVLVLEDGSIHITQGLKDSFVLVDGYQDREVTVIAP